MVGGNRLRNNVISFQLLGWSAWKETRPAAEDWMRLNVGGAEDCGFLPSGNIPMMLRRRATPVGRAALGAAMGLPHVNDARFILASRHGELARTASILKCLVECEPVSPADFGMSVHHGLSGLLSIATKNDYLSKI